MRNLVVANYWNMRCNLAGQAYVLMSPDIQESVLVGEQLEVVLCAQHAMRQVRIQFHGVVTRVRDRELKVEVMGPMNGSAAA